MQRLTKLIAILCLISTAVGVMSIRNQEPLLLIICLGILFPLLVAYQSGIAAGGVTALAILLYPAEQFGWLYGRDTHFTVLKTTQIENLGWPLPQQHFRSRGFADTPFIHFETIISSRITGLTYQPTINPEVLISSLLPILFASISVMFVVVAGRRLGGGRYRIDLAVLPLILWIPFLYNRTGFRRNSLGIAMFCILVYLVILSTKYNSRRAKLLLAFMLPWSVFIHHFAAILSILFIFLIYFYDYWKKIGGPNKFIYLGLISLLTFIGTSLYLKNMKFLINSISLYSFISPTPPNSQIPAAYQLPESNLFFVLNFLTKWLYQLLLGAFLITFWYRMGREKIKITPFVEIAIIWGFLIGALSVIAYISGAIVAWGRIQTYFVVIAAVVLTSSFTKIGRRSIPVKSATTILLCLVVLSSLMFIPHQHTITKQQPYYNQGITNQNFDKSLYAVADHITSFGVTQPIYGDYNTEEVVETSSRRQVNQSIFPIISKHVPDSSYLILTEANQNLYLGSSRIRTNGPAKQISENSDLIYTTGKTSLYT